jgi:hypothetical protein
MDANQVIADLQAAIAAIENGDSTNALVSIDSARNIIMGELPEPDYEPADIDDDSFWDDNHNPYDGGAFVDNDREDFHSDG